MKELLPSSQQQGGLVEQMDALLSLLDKLGARNRPAGEQSSVIQFADGGRLTLPDYLHLEDLKDKRDQRRIEAELSKERMANGRGLVDQLGKALALAAETLSGKGKRGGASLSSPVPAKALQQRQAETAKPSEPQEPQATADVPTSTPQQQQQQGGAQLTDTVCDFCSSPVTIDIAGQPESFVCPECDKVNKLTYG